MSTLQCYNINKQMEKRPRRQIKFKNLFQEGQQSSNPEPPVIVTNIHPTSMPTPTFTPQTQSGIPNFVQPTQKTTLIQPKHEEIKPAAPATQIHKPVELDQSVSQVRPIEIHQRLGVQPVQKAQQQQQVQQAPQMGEQTDKKKSKIEELKSKYLKKSVPAEGKPVEPPHTAVQQPLPQPQKPPHRETIIPKPQQSLRIAPTSSISVSSPAAAVPSPVQPFSIGIQSQVQPPIQPVTVQPAPIPAPIIPPKPQSSQSPPTKPDPPISNSFQEFLQSASHPMQPEVQEIERPMRDSPHSGNRIEYIPKQEPTESKSQVARPVPPSRRCAPPPPSSNHPRRQREFGVYKQKQSSAAVEQVHPDRPVQPHNPPTRDHITEPEGLGSFAPPAGNNIPTKDTQTQTTLTQSAPSGRFSQSHHFHPHHEPLPQIRHTISMVDSHHQSPTHRQQQQPKTLNHLDLINNIPNLIKEVYQAKFIDRLTFENSEAMFGDGRHQTSFFNSKVIEYQFANQQALGSSWLKSFFEGFILNSQQIEQPNRQLSYRFISHAFHIQHPNCPLPPAYLIPLLKLSPDYYLRHEQELLQNILDYLPIIKHHSGYLSEKKLQDFITYAAGRLNDYFTGDEYCKIALHLVMEYPKIFTDELLGAFNKQCRQFGHAAIMYLFLRKHMANKPLNRNTVNNLLFIINSFEENNLNQQCLNMLDMFAQSVGAPAYPVMRELRSRVIAKIDSKEEKNNDNKGGVFGGLINQALKFINAPVKSPQLQPQPQPDESSREDIYYDKQKGRYVIRGEIPLDEQQQQPKAETAYVPPPPPKPAVVHHRHEQHTNGNRNGEQLNRTVGTLPPPPKKNSRLPQNRYV